MEGAEHDQEHRTGGGRPLALLGAGVVAVVAVVLAVVLVLPRVVPGGISIHLGEAQPTAVPPPPPQGDIGVPISLGERVVNLADPGGFRYLKVEIVVSVQVPGVVGPELSSEKLEAERSKLDAQMESIKPRIQDALTSVLTSKTVAELSTPEGKETLRQELIERLQPLLGQRQITGLYFAQFVIQ
ncbi:MAG: flagellar basal body-associated FliL family protein [Sphaerobacter sp.]|nr:flagellar basal body-associated FliL family protein [Sphaerobacter sp.]